MKHDLRDYVSCSMLTILPGFGAFLTWLIMAGRGEAFGDFRAIVCVVLFLVLSGFSGMVYLRLINMLFPMKAGDYTMADIQCFLWKHQTIIRELMNRFLAPFVPLVLRAAYFKLQGVEMGKHATVATTALVVDPLLTKMGDHSVIGEGAVVTAHAVANDRLIIGPIVIGDGATVGIGAVVMPGVTIGESAVVAAGAVVPIGAEIPAYEMWGGIPARKIKAITRQGRVEEAAKDDSRLVLDAGCTTQAGTEEAT